MFNVTDSAAGHLATLLDEAEAPDGMVTRLVATSEGLKLGMDNVKPQDATFDHDGRTVLAIDQQTSQLLDNHTLELEESEKGPALAIK